MQSLGRMVVLFGLLVVVIGFVMMVSNKIPFLGKLPGDITIKRENFQIYFPVTTSLLLSLLVSGVFWLLSIFKGK